MAAHRSAAHGGRVAFDEQMIEFGFWPGDAENPDPSFFILPYPFMARDLSKSGIKPDAAYYSKEKAEFFLKLEDVLAAPDPEAVVHEFLQSGYRIITEKEKWKNLEWLYQPLLTGKGSTALN